MQESLKVKTPEHVTLNFRLAGLGSRGAAQIADTVILSFLYTGMIAIIIFTENQLEWYFNEARSMIVAFAIIVLFAIQWGYFFLFEWFNNGRTPGKMFVGLRVVKEDGGRAPALSLLIRNLLRIVDMLPFYYLVGMLMVFFHPNHKRLGDIVGGTIVIHERKKRNVLKKATPVEKEIDRRGIEAGQYPVGDWERKNFKKNDWNLLKTYVHRYPELRGIERGDMTDEVAAILLPKLGMDHSRGDVTQMEDRLFQAYVELREDWEFEL